jgi:putative sporulation protein YtaF
LYMAAEAALIASAVSVDCLASGFAYGSRNIRIPLRSVFIINLICSAVVGISMLAGSWARAFIPDWLAPVLCFAVLFLLGLSKVLDSAVKAMIRKHSGLDKKINFSLLNIRFMLSLYADPEAADTDRSLTLSGAEAASLAVALSLDGLAVGFGAALGNINAWAVVACSLLTNAAFLMLGERAGRKVASAVKYNIAWVGGVILMALGVQNILAA